MSTYEEILLRLENRKYKWLVTGAAGFIGSNLIETLLTSNQSVVALDNFSTGYQENIDQVSRSFDSRLLNKNFIFLEGDITELDFCKEACKNVDFVLHQAALGSIPRSIRDPINTNKSNINGFLNMLISARDSNVKRFVYFIFY